MNEFWKIVMTSTVMATLISGAVSIITSRIQFNNTLKLNRYNIKSDLSVKVFEELQNALKSIDQSNELPDSDDVQEKAVFAFGAMFITSKEKMDLLTSTLDEIAYLIPEKRALYFENEISKLEKMYVVLLASAYNYKGLPASEIKEEIDIISKDNFPQKIKEYIDATQKLSIEFKNEIISTLRELFGT